MGDQTFCKMVWKRKFWYLICVGSVLVCMLIFTNREETIDFGRNRLQANKYVIASTDRVKTSNFHKTVSGNQNNEDIFHHGLLPTFRLSRTNLPTFNQSLYTSAEDLIRTSSNASSKISRVEITAFSNSSILNPERLDQGKLSYSEIFHKASNRTLLSFIARGSSKTGKSINSHYNRVFQWDDRNPEGWRGLPLSNGQVAPKTDRIIFNRVGKCGSRSMIAMLRDLSQQNGFNLISSTVYNQTHVSKSREEQIVSILDKVQTPYLFQRHIHFVNFKKHEAQEVAYINIIREPIPRMVSQYYFARYGDGISGKGQRGKWTRPIEEYYETIDECVQLEHRDCSGHRAFYIIPFFCGNSKRCTTPSKWAFQRAMYNVINHFLVVGILEEFDLTLKILETVLPTFFSGAMEVYKTDNIAENVTRTSTSFKIPPSNKTFAILKERLKYEYKFYNFVKQRLYRQKADLGL